MSCIPKNPLLLKTDSLVLEKLNKAFWYVCELRLQTSSKIVFTYYNQSCELSSVIDSLRYFTRSGMEAPTAGACYMHVFGCKAVFDLMNTIFAASQPQLFRC
ncbi:hypothetical protein GBA52_000136 [Prunus armeniaca]|nr:hypothetical protein GBA52_000136 [Prunus armeniaca]